MKLRLRLIAILVGILHLQQLLAQPSTEWVFRYNGEGDYSDRFTCMTTDGDGNIYSGGSSVNIGTDRDFLIQKTDGDGNVIWRQMYNASGNGPDEVTAIWVDGLQNVFIAGFGKSADTGNDFLTFKFNTNGTLLWSAIYNYEVANAYDQPNSIAVDGLGNVLVTGQSDSDPSSLTKDDYLTIKYSASGSLLWMQRYNGLGDGTDRAVKVVLDNSNNVYVTGRSYNGNYDDYATIKYDPSGNQQWLKYGDRSFTDRATSMVIDDNANIYVTGWSSNGTNDDFYTIKYNSAGAPQWSKVVDGVDQDRALAIAVDVSGNVFVTGTSDGDSGPFANLNIRTVKYNANGVLQWNTTYDGSAGNDDAPTSLMVYSGEAFITGYSDGNATPAVQNNIITIKYSSTGSIAWSEEYIGNGGFNDAGNALLTDANGNAFVAGYEEDNEQQRNALILKYANTGSLLFNNAFNGAGDNSDNVRDLKIDAAGNIYLTGYAVQRGQNRDFYVLKLGANGDTIWTRYINGSSPDSEDEGQSIAIDGTDQLIVAGFTKNSGTSGDFTTVKFNNLGDSLWLRYYDSPVNENDKAYDMQRDASGNIFITGRTDSDPGITSNDDATTLKYDTDGNLQWVVHFNGAGNAQDRGSFIRTATSGNVYVAGRTFNGNNQDILFIKYNSAGEQQWAKVFDGGFGNDEVRAVALDNNENIYATGISEGASDTADFITIKYSSAGDLAWLKTYNGDGNGGDFGTALAVDPSGKILVTGFSDGDNTAAVNFDMVTIKYNTDGTELWKKIENGTNNLDVIADALITDQFGNAYVAGHSNNGTSSDINYDIVTIRYNSDGIEDWKVNYNSISDTLDEPNFLWLVNNDLFVAGSSWQDGQHRDMILIKYASVTTIENMTPPANAIHIYPNPFEEYINIKIDRSENQLLKFELFDVTGKLIISKKITGTSVLQLPYNLPAGLYHYALTNGQSLLQSGKLIH